jgi:hypothetical protein
MEASMDEARTEIDILLREYEKCKAEQMVRIAFRDNLVFATLGAYGAIIAFAAKDNHLALLILPWVSLVLGWGYLVNDEKVSAIGRYLRVDLSNRLAALAGTMKPEDLFGWEIVHRSDSRRRRRKLEQLVIDMITFVLSGYVALGIFWIIDPGAQCVLKGLVILEALLLLVLGIEFYNYADLKSGR